MTPQRPSTGSLSALAIIRQHWRLMILLLTLSLLVGGGAWLRGQLVNPPGTGTTADDPSFPLACSSVGTIFAAARTPFEAMDVFHQRMTQVVAERQQLLGTAGQWRCSALGDGGDGPVVMPVLTKLASDLPGWYVRVRQPGLLGLETSYRRKPVTFASFPSIVSELVREYACTMHEFEQRGVDLVMSDTDLKTPLPPDVNATWMGKTGRFELVGTTIDDELRRSRQALTRTLLALRSFERMALVSHHMSCLSRATLDFQAGMAMIADLSSCMPKLWDGVTSLHNRTGSVH